MATIDIGPITVPSGDIADVQAALQQRYASNGIPNPTTAQVLEAMRQEVIAHIKQLTKAYRQAQVSVSEPTAT